MVINSIQSPSINERTLVPIMSLSSNDLKEGSNKKMVSRLENGRAVADWSY